MLFLKNLKIKLRICSGLLEQKAQVNGNVFLYKMICGRKSGTAIWQEEKYYCKFEVIILSLRDWVDNHSGPFIITWVVQEHQYSLCGLFPVALSDAQNHCLILLVNSSCHVVMILY